LSNEAKLFYLKEKLEEIKKEKRNYTILMVILFLIIPPIWLETFQPSGLNFIIQAFSWIVIFTIAGVVISTYYDDQKKQIMEEIKQMGELTVEEEGEQEFFCRYCGAQNKTDAVFCESCGKKIA